MYKIKRDVHLRLESYVLDDTINNEVLDNFMTLTKKWEKDEDNSFRNMTTGMMLYRRDYNTIRFNENFDTGVIEVTINLFDDIAEQYIKYMNLEE